MRDQVAGMSAFPKTKSFFFLLSSSFFLSKSFFFLSFFLSKDDYKEFRTAVGPFPRFFRDALGQLSASTFVQAPIRMESVQTWIKN